MMKVDLSFFSMAGVSGNAALKLYGHIAHQRVTILVDSGANSSFISGKLVKGLQLPIEEIPECPIRLSDGYRIAISTFCPKVKLVIQDANFEVSLFPFELSGVEIVLGISWLKTLGTIKANFEHLWIRFENEGRCFELKA